MSLHPLQSKDARIALTYPVLSVQLGRNLVVQVLGVTMVVIVGLTVLPWRSVLIWTLMVAAVVVAEDSCLRIAAHGGRFSVAARRAAPFLRIAATSVYALAALTLIARGAPGDKLFAFALISASVVHVLMRYYRSPVVLAASLAPYLFILGLIAYGLGRRALQQGHVVGAITASFTIAMLAVQFWAARAQLAGAWTELVEARSAAEERERAAEAANRSKSQFLTTMSHELRTPLNGVLGMAQALTGDQLSDVQRERVRIIRRSSESLLAVLNDLLDLSKIEANALELEIVEFDLGELISGVVAAFRPVAERKGLSFDFRLAPDALGHYRGDSARIRRILYSLCENAVKFTDAGSVVLRVERSSGQIVFHVTDTGIGIRADDIPHLFEGFFQADGTLTRRHGGAGVGLAVSHELTTLMGGSLDVSSVLGKGSSFTLKLALEPVAAAAASEAAEAAQPQAEEPGLELRILAAEDNATNQLVLKALLAQAGIDPVVVEHGGAAVDAWENRSWDLILMDIQMPEMNGVDAARAIRRRELETGRRRTPILAVTANAMTHQVAEYTAAGMDGVVSKPIEIASLFNAMELALEMAGPSRAAGDFVSAA